MSQTATVVDPFAVERALEEIRPYLHGDGGDIEVVDIVGSEVRVRLRGSCADCSMQHVTMRAGVERILLARVPGVRSVVASQPEPSATPATTVE
ncbi:MAG TPA: NifU family protein [Mycobacteriales bacterium]|nr:NifU family protein [Mycobacteriales bacterium]